MKETFEILVEYDNIGGMRPYFTPNNNPAASWVGEWETNTKDLAGQVAHEFQRWLDN